MTVSQKCNLSPLNITHWGNDLAQAQQPEAVVLLHGLFGMARNLSGVARALAAEHCVYGFDLPNHGRSPHSNSMTIESMAEAVLAMLNELKLDRVKMLGHSLGGKVAMRIALDHPDRLAKLVVADIAPVEYAPRHQAIFAALDAVDLAACHSRAGVMAVLETKIDDQAVRQFILQNLDKQGEHLQWRMNLPAIKQNYQALSAGLALGDNSQPFNKPTLFIAGGDSSYIKPEYEAVTRALFPAFSYRSIAGAGHWLHAEKPALFNHLVSDFFTGNG